MLCGLYTGSMGDSMVDNLRPVALTEIFSNVTADYDMVMIIVPEIRNERSAPRAK
jgi:hypothetical protein